MSQLTAWERIKGIVNSPFIAFNIDRNQRTAQYREKSPTIRRVPIETLQKFVSKIESFTKNPKKSKQYAIRSTSDFDISLWTENVETLKNTLAQFKSCIPTSTNFIIGREHLTMYHTELKPNRLQLRELFECELLNNKCQVLLTPSHMDLLKNVYLLARWSYGHCVKNNEISDLLDDRQGVEINSDSNPSSVEIVEDGVIEPTTITVETYPEPSAPPYSSLSYQK